MIQIELMEVYNQIIS